MVAMSVKVTHETSWLQRHCSATVVQSRTLCRSLGRGDLLVKAASVCSARSVVRAAAIWMGAHVVVLALLASIRRGLRQHRLSLALNLALCARMPRVSDARSAADAHSAAHLVDEEAVMLCLASDVFRHVHYL